jgi:hypothetical protein
MIVSITSPPAMSIKANIPDPLARDPARALPLMARNRIAPRSGGAQTAPAPVHTRDERSTRALVS